MKPTLCCRWRCPIKTSWRLSRKSKRLMNIMLILVTVLCFVFSIDSMVSKSLSNSKATSVIQNMMVNETLRSDLEQEQKTVAIKQAAVVKHNFTNDTMYHPVNTTCLLNCSKHQTHKTPQEKDNWEEVFKGTKDMSVLAQNLSLVCAHRLQFAYGVFAKVMNVTLDYLIEIPESKLSHMGVCNPRNRSPIKRMGTLKMLCKSNFTCQVTDAIFKHIDIIQSLSIQMTDPVDDIHTETTTGVSVAVTVDFVPNTYDTVVQLYNTFLIHNFFSKHIGEVRVITFDEKSEQPTAELNTMMQVLFGPVLNIATLPRPVRFDQLIFLPVKADSPLSRLDAKSMPLLQEFKEFVFSKYGIYEHHHLDCKRLNITIVWRRDRPTDYIEQKIFNEAELYEAVVKEHPSACVQGVLFDVLPMKEQLQLVQHTDILIGMHGEELTHALFLPDTAGVVELKQFQPVMVNPRHVNAYKALARWRNLKYTSWQNKKSLMEMQHYYTALNIPPVISTVAAMVEKLCPKHRGL